jgi:hypothetical protein
MQLPPQLEHLRVYGGMTWVHGHRDLKWVELEVVHPTQLGLLQQLATLPDDWSLHLKMAPEHDAVPSNAALQQLEQHIGQILQTLQHQQQHIDHILQQQPPEQEPPQQQYALQLQQQQQVLQLQQLQLQHHLQHQQLLHQQQQEAVVSRLVGELQRVALDLGSCSNVTSLGLSVLTRRWGVQLAGQVDWCAAVGKLSKLKYLELGLQVR